MLCEFVLLPRSKHGWFRKRGIGDQAIITAFVPQMLTTMWKTDRDGEVLRIFVVSTKKRRQDETRSGS